MAFLNLPAEIMQAILSFVDDVQDLAECRLVCKTWDPIAEKLMFSKKIFLVSAAKVSQLLQHLKKNPSFAKLVEYVVLDFQDETTPNDLYLQALSAIFTPSLRVLDGYMPISNIYKGMLFIAKKSSQQFNKLEIIPQGQHMATDSNDYKEACLLFKKSLKVVSITITDENMPDWRFINQLAAFDNLAHLILSNGMPNLNTIRRILDNCKQIETLKLSWVDAQNPRLTKTEIQDWFRINDKPKKQKKPLKFLGVSNCFSPVFVEYLMLKFQHIQTAEIDMNIYQVFTSDRIIRVTDEQIHDHHIRVVQALQGAFYYDFKLTCKGWNRLAEEAMFGTDIKLRSNKATRSFYDRLKNAPHIKYWIRHVELLQYYHSEQPDVFAKTLLPLIFNEKLEVFGGIIDCEAFYRETTRMIQGSAEKIESLKVIPHPPCLCSDKERKTYQTLAYCLKETLEQLILFDDWHRGVAFVRKIGEFSALKSLTLAWGSIHLNTLRDILNSCQQLQNLELCGVDTHMERPSSSLHQWFQANDTPSIAPLHTLTLDIRRTHIVLEYLRLKYPVIGNVELVLASPTLGSRGVQAYSSS
ncbi:hypothetical protein MBANPS3_003108 [Mucor bainieri]